MNAISMETNIDLSILVADAFVDSGLFDDMMSGIGRLLRSLPKKVVTWLGTELSTPENSAAPHVSFAGGDLVNGVIFVEANTPSYWLLVKANADGGQQRTNHAPPFGGHDPYRRANEPWPNERPGTRSLWPDAFADEAPPWEGDPWRR